MADTGFVLAGTGANRPVAAQTDWKVPGNITTDDGVNSETTLGSFSISDHLGASNFGFSSLIPAGSTIDGIEVQVGDYSSDMSIAINFTEVRLILADDSNGSEDKSMVFVQPAIAPNTDEAGGATDLWGRNDQSR